MDKRVVLGSLMKTNDESGDEAEWEDVDEDEQVDIFAVDTKCLFCDENALLTAIIEHLKTAHAFDIFELKTIHKFGVYEYICFINYLRSCHPKIDAVKKQLAGTEKSWRDDKYLKPVHQDEPFLLLDIDNEEEDAEMEAAEGGDAALKQDTSDQMSSAYANAMMLFAAQAAAANSKGGQSKNEVATLQRQIAALRAENLALRGTMRRLIEGEDAEDEDDENVDDEEAEDEKTAEGTTTKLKDKKRELRNGVADSDNGEWYFETYDDFQIHLEMLSDRVRTDAYRDFVQRNASIFADKTVLDIGCGTGILSMFVARDTTAQRVVAVDRAGIAFDAMSIVRENDLAKRISIKHARVEDICPKKASSSDAQAAEKPTTSAEVAKKRKSIEESLDHVDIIVSEWMGYALLYECMLDSVLAARDMFTPAPQVFPNVYTLCLAGIDDQDLTSRYVTYWNDVYGFSMSTMRSRVCRSVVQDITLPDRIVTNEAQLREFDLRTLQRTDLEPFLLFSEFELHPKKTADGVAKDVKVSAFCLWFDTAFVGCPQPVTFTTSPHGEKTHWQQSFMFLEEPIQLPANDKLSCRLVIRRNPKEPRHLIFDMFVNGQSKTFMMS